MTNFEKLCKGLGIGFIGTFISWSVFLSILFIIEDGQHGKAAVAISTPKSAWIVFPIIISVLSFAFGLIEAM